MINWSAEKILEELAETGRVPLGPANLAAKLGLDRKAVGASLLILFQRGLAEKENGLYRISPAGRELLASGGKIRSGPQGEYSKPRSQRGTFREKLWKAARITRKFTLPELISLAASGQEKSPHNNARNYINSLEKTGFLARLPKRAPGASPTSNGFIRWAILRDTGPKPPIYNLKKKTVHDPNTGKTYHLGDD